MCKDCKRGKVLFKEANRLKKQKKKGEGVGVAFMSRPPACSRSSLHQVDP